MAKKQVIQAISSRGKEYKADVVSFDEVEANTVKLGGKNNEDGLLKLYDADGNLIVTLDNLGTLVQSGNYRILEDDMEISIMNFENLVSDHSFEMIVPDYTSYDETYFDYSIDSSVYWGAIGTPKLVSIKNSEYPLTINPTRYGFQSVAVTSANYINCSIVVNPNTIYFISPHFCNGNRTSSSPQIILEFYDTELNLTNTTTQTFTSNDGEFNWKRDGFKFTTGSSDALLTINLKSSGTGYAYFDAIQLIKNTIACVYDPESTAFKIDTTGVGGELTDGDKGDITVTGTGATWTIDNKAVTLAKMNDVATGTVFYRKTAGTGVPEVQSLATLKTDLGLTGTNSGDQVVPSNEAGASNNFLTAYNNTTGAFSKAQPTWANINKSTSSIADITTRSHTSLTDIGTNTHANIDTALTRLANTSGTNTGDQDISGKEDKSNKENTTIDTSTTKYPTVNLLKTGLDTKEPVITKKTGFNLDLSTTATDIKMNGTQSLGVATTLPRADHVHPSDTSKANDNAVVKLTGDQTVAGVKTFSSFPVTPSSAPTTDYQVANKKYVDDSIAGAGGGDMLKATYDPSNVNDDVFDMDNMKDGLTYVRTHNDFTSTYKTKLDNAITGEEVDTPSTLSGRAYYFSLFGGDYIKPVTADDAVYADDYVTTIETCLKTGYYPSTATWTYSSADSPTFVISVNADMTGIIGVGMKIKLTQTTVKHFIVTKMGAYSGGATLITLYGGTDYTLTADAVSNVFYSNVKAPLGFPQDPDKWSVVFTDTQLRSQASPSINTWYNLSNVALVVPIGAWYLSYNVMLQSGGAGDTSGNRTVRSTLSTANNSDSNPEFANGYATVSAYVRSQAVKEILKSVAVKTTWYLNTLTEVATTAIYNLNGTSTLTIKARCAYL